MAPTDPQVAVARGGENADDDPKGSAHSIWAPFTVKKDHRKRATFIWVSLLMAFFVYIGYIVWDTVDARRHPAASVELKQSPFTFPDVAICAGFLQGCLSDRVYCLEDVDLILGRQAGFMEESGEFLPDNYPDVTKVKEEFPHCSVMPLSKLTVNETGIKNGDITYFSASVWTLWDEDPYNEFNATEDGHAINSQYISVHFVDIEQDVDQIGEKITDVKLPYERIVLTHGEWFTTTMNHMVISLSEFSGITKNGDRKEREQTYSQTTTSAKDNWYWTGDSSESTYAFLKMELLITKFEYTTVVEVDPVDMWAIIGAIGGVWQFVVVAFGVFFILSEKQPPDMKMCKIYKTVSKPASTLRRFSSVTSAASSQQDTEIDATDEDLPPGWVKRQGRTGNVYYFHRGTGATSVSPPNIMDGRSASAEVTTAPLRQRAVRSSFRAAYDPQGSATDGAQDSTDGTTDGGSLPPGWEARVDGNGRVYYADTVNKNTQWHLPTSRAHSTSGSGIQAVDTPMRRRGSNTATSQDPTPAAALPSTTTAAPGDVVDEPLPLNWKTRITPDGETYNMETVDTMAQWERPAWRPRSTSRTRAQAVHATTRHTQRGSNTASSQAPTLATALPSTTTAATGGVVDEPQPPDWETCIAPGGKTSYDKVRQKTQLNQPASGVRSTSGSRVQAPNTTTKRTRRSSKTASSQVTTPATVLPSITTAAAGRGVETPLPPNWEIHITKDGKKCYGNSVTKKTQWDTPV